MQFLFDQYGILLGEAGTIARCHMTLTLNSKKSIMITALTRALLHAGIEDVFFSSFGLKIPIPEIPRSYFWLWEHRPKLPNGQATYAHFAIGREDTSNRFHCFPSFLECCALNVKMKIHRLFYNSGVSGGSLTMESNGLNYGEYERAAELHYLEHSTQTLNYTTEKSPFQDEDLLQAEVEIALACSK